MEDALLKGTMGGKRKRDVSSLVNDTDAGLNNESIELLTPEGKADSAFNPSFYFLDFALVLFPSFNVIEMEEKKANFRCYGPGWS